MPDIFNKATRSRIMASIRSSDTKPEILVKKGLHKIGLRRAILPSKLPGKPDLVFPKYKFAIFVNGCFWHGHACHNFKWPKSNAVFWKVKINRNKQRDIQVRSQIKKLGWKTLIVWECKLITAIRKGNLTHYLHQIRDKIKLISNQQIHLPNKAKARLQT